MSQPRHTPAPIARWLPYAVIALVVAVTIAHHLPRLLAFQWAMLRYPFPTQGSESLIVYEAGRLARGQSIYVANTPDAHGFVSGPYTPLYFLAVAATLQLTPTVFAGGRAIAFASWLVLLAALGALVWLPVRRRTALVGAATAVVMLAVFVPGAIWAVRIKPTVPALALAALGLLVVQHGYRSRRHLWALLPLIAAYFTKQTAIAAPLAATLFLAIHAGPRAALRFAGLGALGGGALFLALDVVTRHQFYQHIISDHRLPWRPQLLLNFGALFLRDSWPLLAAGLAGALVVVLTRTISITPYYLLTALPLVLTVGVVGADHDHLIELALALAAALGTAVAVLSARRDAIAWAAYPLAALLLAQLVTAWTPDDWYAGELTLPDPRVRAQLDLIVNNLRQTEGEALAEEIGLLILAGKPAPYDDPQLMAALARAGRWDQTQLLDDLARQRFSLVILPPRPRDELWTAEVLAAIEANYTLKFRDVWFTYEAKRLR